MKKVKTQEEIDLIPDAIIETKDSVETLRQDMANFWFYVNEQRAIINDSDGLKPVHRRILYTYYHSWLKSSDKFTKCAKITGDTMANWHPHWDSYWSLARMVQSFVLNVPLITWQGNFWSLDTEPAAPRYTESKITKFAEDVLFDEIKYKSTPFKKNYSWTLDEIEYFPAKLPLGLINSNMGIWYGLASNIPWFNINEVIDSMINLIQDETYDITKSILGPDFPSKGQIISSRDEIKMVLETGRGTFKVRWKIDIDENENALVITELPYNVSPKDLQARILEIQQLDKKTKISDIADHSAQGEIKIVVYYKKGTNLLKEKNLLFKKTKIETSIPLNLMVLENNRTPTPKNIKEYLNLFIDFRKKCFETKIRVQIDNLEKRLHILEGLLKLKDKKILDDIIDQVRTSEDLEKTKESLMISYSFSLIQIEHILNLKLSSLSKISINEVQEEFDNKTYDKIDKVDILENRLTEEIIKEWIELKNKYWHERKTILKEESSIEDSMESLTEDKPITIIYTENGYIKRVDSSEFKTQNRGWQGSSAMNLKEEDSIKAVIPSNYHDKILFISNKGKFYFCRWWDIPEGNKGSKGIPIQNFVDCKEEWETIEFIFSINKENLEQDKFMIVFKDGTGLKVSCQNALPKRSGSKFIKEWKEIISITLLKNQAGQIIIGKKNWYANKFSVASIPEKKSVWQGVKLTRFKTSDDYVQSATFVENEAAELLILSTNWSAKRVISGDIKQSRRGGMGVKIWIKKGDSLAGIIWLTEEVMSIKIITSQGKIIVTDSDKFRQISKNAKGVRAINLKDWDEIKTIII